jgi:hypothetical protein
MKLVFTIAMVTLLAAGCSITIIDRGEHDPYDDEYDVDDYDWWGDLGHHHHKHHHDSDETSTANDDQPKVDKTSTSGPDTSTSDDSATSTSGPETSTSSNSEIKGRLKEQLKSINPILTKEYIKLLGADSDLTGKILMRVAVSKDGKIKNAEVLKNTTGNDKLATAIQKEIMAMKLSPGNTSAKDVVFDVPFEFKDGVGQIVGMD